MQCIHSYAERRMLKTRTEIQEISFHWLRTKRQDRIPTLEPRRLKFGRNVQRVGYA